MRCRLATNLVKRLVRHHLNVVHRDARHLHRITSSARPSRSVVKKAACEAKTGQRERYNRRREGLEEQFHQPGNWRRDGFDLLALFRSFEVRCHALSAKRRALGRPDQFAFDSLSVVRAALDHGVGPVLNAEEVQR